ncbi:MAG: hypothetical protein Roseis2KO_49810 [Roseivirga sp.]
MINLERDRAFYNFLGEFAFNQLSDQEYENFDLVRIELTVQPGAYGFSGHFIVDGAKFNLDRENPRSVIQELKSFHFESTEDGSSKWNKLVFSLSQDKKFSSELIWDEVRQVEVDKYNDEAEKNNPSYKRPKWPWEITRTLL